MTVFLPDLRNAKWELPWKDSPARAPCLARGRRSQRKGENDMSSIRSGFRILGVVTMLWALGGFPVAAPSQAQTAAPAASAAPSTFCGSQPLCYEANDFAATITDFRTSTAGGYKVIDVIIRFQNKTNQPLILGYLAGSGTALDDRGNRYIVYGGNGFRGIGQVYGGNNFDPKFNLRAGGFGDAQFELMWAPGQTAYGLTFELNLSVDEINTIEAGQHTLGGEFPLHYRGLTNGVSSAAPGQATAFLPQGQVGASQGLPPCGPGGTLAGAANSASGQVPASANAAVSNAQAAISSLGSLFGKKKTATHVAPTGAAASTASTAPCAPASGVAGTSTATGTQTSTGMSTGTSPATSGSPVNAAGTRSTGVAARTNAATPAPVAATKTAATTPAKPSPAVAKAPAPTVNAAKKTVVTAAPQKPTPASAAVSQ
jgi:hypothetical protein